MDDGVAGRTECDQPLFVVNAWPPVMDGPLVPRPTPLAAVIIAKEDVVAQAGKGAGGVAALPVAGGAEPGNGREAAAIKTKERFLAKISHGLIIAADNEDYH